MVLAEGVVLYVISIEQRGSMVMRSEGGNEVVLQGEETNSPQNRSAVLYLFGFYRETTLPN